MKDFSNLTAYELIKTEALPDLQGEGYYFRHKKSGAKIAYISNSDDNKVFCISFRTPPTDSTGAAHILEHSVLCGSEQFPVKDPFIELAKGSLNTFLNAMTYPDKTIYPVASCNVQDFKNLMYVYMDAVFYPNIYKQEEIFKQEGWHYELASEDAELQYNGIVYSEMKGAFSSPEQVLFREAMNSMFPDTSYGVESGGHPDHIPELDYEKFLDFHRRYYHPVNSYIYLYGNMDIEERLNWMDAEYLSHFDRITLDSSLKKQELFGGFHDTTRYYSVEEEKNDGVYYAYNVLSGESFSVKEGIAFEILDQVLFSNPGAPVKQALLDAGIGEDYITNYNGDVLQPYFTVAAKNAKAGQKDQFVSVLREALAKCVKDGLKETTVRAAINAQEFRYREADFGRFPKGLMYGINMMSSWLYDENEPFMFLNANDIYTELKALAGTGYFEELIQKYFLDSKHGSVLQLLPKKGMNAEKDAAMKQKLAAYKDSLSAEEKQKLVEATKALKAYQDEPSTKEQLETIPMLAISDIEKKAKGFKNERFLEDKAEAVWHNIYTNGISYMRFLFDAKKVTVSEVPYVGLISDVLSIINTKKQGYKELADELNTYTGGFSTELLTYATVENYKNFAPKFGASIKALTGNTKKAVELVREILCETDYTDTKRLYEILLEVKSKMEMRLMQAGHAAVVSRVSSYYSENAVFEEATKGITYYEFVKELLTDYDTKKQDIAKNLQNVAEKLFTKGNLIVSLTAAEDGKQAFEAEADTLLNALFTEQEAEELTMPCVKKNEGFKTPGQVQYVSRSGNFKEKGIEYHGSFDVLQILLSYGYLWNEIRVKGGAYGAGILLNDISGSAATYSYRDPNLRETNAAYEGIVSYVANFEADEREMTKNILGTMSSVDAPLTPRTEGYRSLMAYLTGRTEADVQKNRDEILSTTAEDIRGTKAALEAMLESGGICAIGSAAKVEECKDMFDEVKALM